VVRQVQKIHVRFGGRSYDWAPERLGLDSRSMALASDLEIKRSVAKMLDVELERLEFHAIDRPETGNIILRPEAVYG